MSDISKPPPRLVNEDLIEKTVAKRPVSRLTEMREAPDPTEKKKKPLLKREAPAEGAEKKPGLFGKKEAPAKAEAPAPKEKKGIFGIGGKKADPSLDPKPVKQREPKRSQPEKPADSLLPEAPEAAEPASTEETSYFKDEANPTTGETRLIATREDIGAEHLAEFAKSSNSVVRAAVAGNKSTDLKTLTRLKKDKDVTVLVALIGNPSFPSKLLPGFLAQAKKNEDILYALAEREDLPPKLAKQLSSLIPDE